MKAGERVWWHDTKEYISTGLVVVFNQTQIVVDQGARFHVLNKDWVFTSEAEAVSDLYKRVEETHVKASEMLQGALCRLREIANRTIKEQR